MYNPILIDGKRPWVSGFRGRGRGRAPWGRVAVMGQVTTQGTPSISVPATRVSLSDTPRRPARASPNAQAVSGSSDLWPCSGRTSVASRRRETQAWIVRRNRRGGARNSRGRKSPCCAASGWPQDVPTRRYYARLMDSSHLRTTPFEQQARRVTICATKRDSLSAV